MNNELLSLTLALAMLDDVSSYLNGLHIDFNAQKKTIFTTSGLYVKKIAEATGQEIRKRPDSFVDLNGELREQIYYEVPVKGWTLQVLDDPDTATY